MTDHWIYKEDTPKMKFLISIGMGILVGLWVTLAYAGDTVSHSVRINVVHKNVIAFGDETSATFEAPSSSFQKINNGDGYLDSLHWFTSPTGKKISVSVKESPVHFHLQLPSQNADKSSDQKRVTMQKMDQNIVTSASGGRGSFKLKYFCDETGQDNNNQFGPTVTYTMTDDF